MDLAQGGGQVGNVFEGFGGEDQIERGVGVGQSLEVLGANAADHGAGGDIVAELAVRQAGEQEEERVQSLDLVDLGHAEGSGFGRSNPVSEGRGRCGRVAEGVEGEENLGHATGAKLRAAEGAIARLLACPGLDRRGSDARSPFQFRADDPASVEFWPPSPADGTAIEPAMADRPGIFAESPGQVMAAVPDREQQTFDTEGNHRAAALTRVQEPGARPRPAHRGMMR